jgi:membrane fusion protein, multidrug efflux system
MKMPLFRTLSIAALVASAGLGWSFWPKIAPLAAQVPALSGLIKTNAAPPPAANAARSVPVVTNKVERKSVPITLDAVGTVQAIASIPIRARIDSQVSAVHVEEGAQVKAGDLLFTLDARTQLALHEQSTAQIQKGEALLEQAKRDLARSEDLLARNVGSSVQRDSVMTLMRVQEAQLIADRAQRQNLATMLKYTEIRAPVSGRIGSIAAKIGTVVRAADTTALATVNQFDPIYVVFAIPQSSLGPLKQAMALGPVAVEARAPTQIVRGTVAFIENAVDLATGTVTVKASMPNSSELLWPGAFASVKLHLGEENDATVVPSAAVQMGQDGAFVFIVKDDKAQLKKVKTERTQGDLTVIACCLVAGDDVVTEGQLRLVNGAAVTRSLPKRAAAAHGNEG